MTLRILATMIADPKAITRKVLESWSRDLDNDVLTGALAGVVAGSPHARAVDGEVGGVGRGMARQRRLVGAGPPGHGPDLRAFGPGVRWLPGDDPDDDPRP